jgi:hypothetical protein
MWCEEPRAIYMFVVYNEQDTADFGRPNFHRHRNAFDFVFSL